MHGYQLFDFIERGLSSCTNLTKSTAYYLLKQMADDGWIIEEQSQEGNRPPRKIYRLTPLGENAYQHLLRETLSAHTPQYFSGDTGLAFLDTIPRQEGLELLQKRRAALAAALAEIEATPTHPGGFQWAIQHQASFLAHELDWLDQLIRSLSE